MLAPMLALAILTTYAPSAIAQSLRQTPDIENTQFEPDVKIRGVEANTISGDGADREFNSYANRTFIRSWVNKRTGFVMHQLYVWIWYRGDSHYFRFANNEDAQPLGFTEISTDVISCRDISRGCVMSESFGVDLSSAQLAANPLGFGIKCYAKDGSSIIVQVTQTQIREQLQAVQRIQRGLR